MFSVRSRELHETNVVVFESGYANQGSWVSVFDRSGDWVMLEGIFRRDPVANFVAGTSYANPFWVPEHLRPKQIYYSGVVCGVNADVRGSFVIGTGGDVEYRHQTGSGGYISFAGMLWRV